MSLLYCQFSLPNLARAGRLLQWRGAIALILCSLCLTACDRGGDGVPVLDPDFVDKADPDRFLQFINQQVGLPAGDYTIVAGTQIAGENGGFTISVLRDDETTASYSGTWTSSGGTDENSIANPRFTFTMPYSGGATFSLTSSVATCLYLLDSGGTLLYGKNGGNCSNPQKIEMPQSKINNTAHGTAYYRAIDPDSTRDTLQKWIDANGFGQPCPVSIPDCETHVIFRDTKDLGYGRDMRLRRNGNGALSFYVRNFSVDRLRGLGYTALNLEAAIENNVRWHFGSNAIEFSTYPYGVGEPRDGELVFNTAGATAPLFAKFYTFAPDERIPDATEYRLDVVDLDGRGGKSMPGPCITCHGGTARPLQLDGSFAPVIPGAVPGDTFAHLQAIEVDTLGFSEIAGYSRAEQEAALGVLNQAVLRSYETEKNQYTGVAGYWVGDFAAELLKGHYGGNVGDANDYSIPELSFVEYVPTDWQPDNLTAMPPAGSDDLFREVVGKHCAVCHDKRGTDKNRNQSFYTYQAFNDFSSRIEFYIFHKGLMPLGLLNFDIFWDNSEPGRAELLASHLNNFSSFDANGNIQTPGVPIAVPVAPANTNVPVTLSGEGSPFAIGYSWSVLSGPNGANTSLSAPTAMRTVFNTDIMGTYTLRLVVTGEDGTASSPVDFQVTTSNALPLPASIRFDTNIRSVMQTGGSACVSCHAAAGEPGVPVYYTGSGQTLYFDVLARVNFKEPLESPLLTKPSGSNHFGNLRPGFDLAGGDRSNYDLFLNWILQGAPQ